MRGEVLLISCYLAIVLANDRYYNRHREVDHSKCVDKNKRCSSWVELQFCTEGQYKKFMSENCKRSCGACEGDDKDVRQSACDSQSCEQQGRTGKVCIRNKFNPQADACVTRLFCEKSVTFAQKYFQFSKGKLWCGDSQQTRNSKGRNCGLIHHGGCGNWRKLMLDIPVGRFDLTECRKACYATRDCDEVEYFPKSSGCILYKKGCTRGRGGRDSSVYAVTECEEELVSSGCDSRRCGAEGKVCLRTSLRVDAGRCVEKYQCKLAIALSKKISVFRGKIWCGRR